MKQYGTIKPSKRQNVHYQKKKKNKTKQNQRKEYYNKLNFKRKELENTKQWIQQIIQTYNKSKFFSLFA